MTRPLAGTKPFTPGETGWTANFSDHYAKQIQQTLAWLERELVARARERDRVRTGDGAVLVAKRNVLRELTGYELFAAPPALLRLTGNVTDAEVVYELVVDNGLTYSGRRWRSKGEVASGLVLMDPATAAAQPDLVAAYTGAGCDVVAPALVGDGRSLGHHPVYKWYAYPDHEVVHFLAFIAGGALAGFEAAELIAVGSIFAMLEEARTPLPIALDLRDRHTLSATVAASLHPGWAAQLVLHPEVERLDHLERDVRANTIWRFHEAFDGLTLLQLAECRDYIFVETGATPSAAYGRAAAWFEAGPGGTRVRRHADAGAKALAGVVTQVLADAPRSAPTDSVKRPQVEPLAADVDFATLYARSLVRKLDHLCDVHQAAAHQRARRYDRTRLTPEAYRERVAESLDKVMGPPLAETQERTVRTRLRKTTPTHELYEVLLESVAGVTTAGLLLVPHGAAAAPAVICQHGLMGRPDYLAGEDENWIYYRLAQHLAEKGYVTFAPFMTWGWGGLPVRDRLAQYAYALGITPNRFETAQLHAIVDFLSGRDEVDAARIGFYGLSYGGHASVWLAAHEPRLSAVITAGHFNDWQKKLTDPSLSPPLTRPTAYIAVNEGLDMFTYDVLRELSHAEMVTRFAPRPYMVENGLSDTVTPTDWVDAEYARVAAVYTWLGEPQNTEIDHYAGPHRVWGERSFLFLHQHLRDRSPS